MHLFLEVGVFEDRFVVFFVIANSSENAGGQLGHLYHFWVAGAEGAHGCLIDIFVCEKREIGEEKIFEEEFSYEFEECFSFFKDWFGFDVVVE